MIEFRSVQKIYDKKVVAVTNASFKIEQGDFVFLVGENGAGKSSILKMMYKEEKPSSGDIFVFNQNTKRMSPKKLRRRIGVVFQDHSKYFLPNKSVYDNVAYVLACLGENPFKIRKKVNAVLEMLGLADKAKRKPYELSGGQKQCLGIARAIVNNPSIIICDEPTADLSAANKELVMGYLNEINSKGTTVIMVTHDADIINSRNENPQYPKRLLEVKNGRLVDEQKAKVEFDSEKLKEKRRKEQAKDIETVMALDESVSQKQKEQRG